MTLGMHLDVRPKGDLLGAHEPLLHLPRRRLRFEHRLQRVREAAGHHFGLAPTILNVPPLLTFFWSTVDLFFAGVDFVVL